MGALARKQILRCDRRERVLDDPLELVPVDPVVQQHAEPARCPTYGGRTKRSAFAAMRSSWFPGGAAHQIAKRPSPWWSSSSIRKHLLPRTKKLGAPWLG